MLANVTNVPMESTFRWVGWLLLAMVVALDLILAFPDTALRLPRQLGYRITRVDNERSHSNGMTCDSVLGWRLRGRVASVAARSCPAPGTGRPRRPMSYAGLRAEPGVRAGDADGSDCQRRAGCC